MSVLMVLRLPADPDKLEEFAAANRDQMGAIAQLAKEHGVISHRFYGREGEIMVVDEWESEAGFRAFFEAASGKIGPMMGEVGVTAEPEPTFWRRLETYDEV